MEVIVTCGLSYEPIDQVRRLTNFSTGGSVSRKVTRRGSDGWNEAGVERPLPCRQPKRSATPLTLW
jgi:phosphopantothenoylcysteine synthetase/decarboxylase